MGRVPEVAEVDDPDEDADDGDDLGEGVPEVVEFAFEGSLFVDLGGDGYVDVAYGGALTGKNDDGARASVDDSCTLSIFDGQGLTVKWNHESVRELTEKSMFVISCFTALGSGTTSTDLLTLTLSPVRIAWSMRKLLDETERSRQSAGILSPTATATMSPGTSSSACIRPICPSRKTLASSGEYSFKACRKMTQYANTSKS